MPALCNTLMPSRSIGSKEHRSHKRSKDVFDGDRHFLNLKLNLPPPLLLLLVMHSLVVLLYKSTLGSSDMTRSATCLPNYREFIEQTLERATTIRHHAHSPMRAIQNGGRGNFEEVERLFFENRFKKINSLGKAIF